MTTSATEALAEKKTLTNISMDDFVTGWIAALASLGVTTVRMESPRFYRAAVKAYEKFAQLCEQQGYRPQFVIWQTKYYGDAPDFRNAIYRATARDLVSLDNPDFVNMRLKYTRDTAGYLFRYLSGGEDLYLPVAEAFRSEYHSTPTVD
ncbi:MAG: hypothetical protein LBG60_17255 [Bifidobacteriaceae bacterium]|jgi:hypothetical protein|nr:hypothetical protein [Bifidobacteriaceae bacterium]